MASPSLQPLEAGCSFTAFLSHPSAWRATVRRSSLTLLRWSRHSRTPNPPSCACFFSSLGNGLDFDSLHEIRAFISDGKPPDRRLDGVLGQLDRGPEYFERYSPELNECRLRTRKDPESDFWGECRSNWPCVPFNDRGPVLNCLRLSERVSSRDGPRSHGHRLPFGSLFTSPQNIKY